MPRIRSRRRRGPAAAVVLAALLAACEDRTIAPAPETSADDPAPAPAAPTDSASLSALVSTTGAIGISPGQSIQSFVDRYPGGTKFLLRAGTHYRQTIRPKSGQQFLGQWPNTILDGGNYAQYAFETLRTSPSNVVIQQLKIQRYATPNIGQGAIQGDNGKYWTIEGNEIRNNRTVGVRVGDGFKLLRNNIHHNGINGIGGYKADNVLIDGNQVHYNNTSNTTLAPSVSTIAGIKMLLGHNLRVVNNNVHHNKGKGIWTDHMYLNTVVENNRVTDNYGPGIWHESSYNARIRYNYVRNNGLSGASWLEAAGIQVSMSPDVEIAYNTVEYNTNSITAMEAASYSTSGPYGTKNVRNLKVHHNTVRMSKGRNGIATNRGDYTVYTSRNNKWYSNTYYTGSLSAPFYWRNSGYSVSRWRAIPQDGGGTFRY